MTRFRIFVFFEKSNRRDYLDNFWNGLVNEFHFAQVRRGHHVADDLDNFWNGLVEDLHFVEFRRRHLEQIDASSMAPIQNAIGFVVVFSYEVVSDLCKMDDSPNIH